MLTQAGSCRSCQTVPAGFARIQPPLMSIVDIASFCQERSRIPPQTDLGIEYKIKFSFPEGYNTSALLKKLPNPIDGATMTRIYDYKVEPDGFYFVDHLVDEKVASVAFKRFVNEALRHGSSVEIVEP